MRNENGETSGYLGYGIIESKGGKRGSSVPHKKGLVEGLNFQVTLKFRPNPSSSPWSAFSMKKGWEAIGKTCNILKDNDIHFSKPLCSAII